MGEQRQGKKKVKKGAAAAELARRELVLARQDLEEATRRATGDAQIFSSTLHDLLHAVEGAANTSLVALANSTEKFHSQVEVARHDVEDARAQLDALRREMNDVRAVARAQLDAACREVTAARADAIEQAERSVHEIERQARAALHRSTERLGVMLAQAEDDAVEARNRIGDLVHDTPEALPAGPEAVHARADDVVPHLAQDPAPDSIPALDVAFDVPVEPIPAAPVDVAFDESFESPFTAASDPVFDAIFDTAPDATLEAVSWRDASGSTDAPDPVDAPDAADAPGPADPITDLAAEQAVFDRLVAEFRSSPFAAPFDAPLPAPGDAHSDTALDALADPALDAPADATAALPRPWDAGVAPFAAAQVADLRPVAGAEEPSEQFAPSPVRNGRAVEVDREPELFEVGPVFVTVPVDTLDFALASLAGREAQFVRVAVVPVDEGVRRVLRLSSFDGHGRWDVHEVRARSRATSETSAVIAFSALVDALEAAGRYADLTEATIVVEGGFNPVVTVEGHDLRCEPDAWSPAPPQFGQPLERVDLAGLPGPSAVLTSRLGRLAVPPPLVAHLRTLEADEGLLLDVDGTPMLQVSGPETPNLPRATCVAVLAPITDDTEATALDRRRRRGAEVGELVAALAASTPLPELQMILETGTGYAQRRAAAHPSLPTATIARILQSAPDPLRAAAASNPSIDEGTCGRAVFDPSPAVRAALAANLATPLRLLEQLAGDPVAGVRVHVVGNARTPVTTIERLAADTDPTVRRAVAARTDVSPDVLRELARDPDGEVCATVARNWTCPPDVLEALLSIAPAEVFANPNAPEAVLSAGVLLDSPTLRAAVAANPATPADALKRLARDRDPRVLEALQGHPNAASGMKRRLQRRLQAKDER